MPKTAKNVSIMSNMVNVLKAIQKPEPSSMIGAISATVLRSGHNSRAMAAVR
ncbi:hypothetical protein D3C83_276690 [compost metagenome]